MTNIKPTGPGGAAGVWINKGTKPQNCPNCKIIVYRVWKWDEDKGCMGFVFHDCNGAGNFHPTPRRGGAGRLHVCAAKEGKAA